MDTILNIIIYNPLLDKPSATATFCEYAVAEAVKEFARARGTQTTGFIIGMSAHGVPNTSLGQWELVPNALITRIEPPPTNR